VTKINASGTALVYSTYLGGNDYEDGSGIAVDASGNAYVTGVTDSPDFPLVKPIDSTLGEVDAFVVKISGGPSVGEILSDIKTNAADGPVTLSPQDRLSITITLDNKGNTDNADWWLAVTTPFGLYFYTFTGRTQTAQPAYQGPLFPLTSFEVLNMPASVLPAGTYTFYFGVDTVMDGNITMGNMYYDFVQVDVVK
jgi:hypothetical protein